jgi:hypothetical protein
MTGHILVVTYLLLWSKFTSLMNKIVIIVLPVVKSQQTLRPLKLNITGHFSSGHIFVHVVNIYLFSE